MIITDAQLILLKIIDLETFCDLDDIGFALLTLLINHSGVAKVSNAYDGLYQVVKEKMATATTTTRYRNRIHLSVYFLAQHYLRTTYQKMKIHDTH